LFVCFFFTGAFGEEQMFGEGCLGARLGGEYFWVVTPWGR